MCPYPSPTLSQLVINPNGSTAITNLIQAGINRYTGPNTVTTYWTCPYGPAVLQSQDDIDKSTAACLEPLIKIQNSKRYDAFLLACYADHPLGAALQARLEGLPVVSIFEASVHHALAVLQPSKRFAILTTGNAYEEQLSRGVTRLLDTKKVPLSRFAGVVSTGVGWSDVEKGIEGIEMVKAKVKEGVRKLLGLGDIGAICIGGVILFGMEEWIREVCEAEMGRADGQKVIIVDQLEAGVMAAERAMQKVGQGR
ncbi:hypothetical protein LTR10_013115 [Elasticomyces elasticus]|uniref:Asp/Glu/hydantoin racemase n=1 Tax=Exophiala sideris TaxID=1016849 RepID=A0ABR0JAU7_9EURO|nr:hypothetical protein LTR10_013115 [Elasticomyces elasticus]KAK5030490.1 hypothetical protein LTS07_005274 [Exophiala sideris]KAK5060425.1 hypothetical protein LTR69_005742 [Exophiala sideris]